MKTIRIWFLKLKIGITEYRIDRFDDALIFGRINRDEYKDYKKKEKYLLDYLRCKLKELINKAK